MSWFETLMGFREESPEQVRSQIAVDGHRMKSLVSGQEVLCGTLDTPTLSMLRRQVAETAEPAGTLRVSEIVANVQTLHCDSENSGALFQVASQFNLLEMVSPSRTPEHGVGIYEDDRTQGPACAIAAGAGTIYRNYFAPVNGRIGQSVDNQIDCLQDVGKAIGNTDLRLWTMRNGYAMPSAAGLQEITDRLASINEQQLDFLRGTLRIGIQSDTQVTLGKCEHTVTQAYCSALPVAYCSHPSRLWALFAGLVLEAAYEATFCAAVLNSAKTGNCRLFLTLLGGGAFGNEADWICSAIERLLNLFSNRNLDVAIVSYGSSNPQVGSLIKRQRR